MTSTAQSPDVSVILVEESTSAPILISDDSIARIEESLLKQCKYNLPGSNSSATIEEQFLDCSCQTSCCDTTKRKKLGKKFLECSSYTPCTTKITGKSVKVQVPEVVEQLFFKNEPGSSSDRKVKLDYECEAVRKQSPESIGRSSEVESPSSSCASARAQYYHNKLLATLQILQNKEDTVRVQAESLSVAEARIASLTARSADLKREIERKGRELKIIRETLQTSKIEKCDVSITAQVKEIDNQKNIVTTLQNNLGVIEDLYRECFYETAKQEGLIEMLRKSYLDVRLMDKEKSDQISRLHNVINTQKWSLDQCQDIASDVENLKVEISNFLNNSNNDSGVWEESLAGGLTDDLQDIADQLLRLLELLSGECTCGFEEENRRLRQNNEALEMQVNEFRQKNADYENILENKDSVDKQYQQQIKAKENELHSIRQQLAAVECNTRERGQTCETIKQQLQQTQQLLSDKNAELARAHAQCQQHEQVIKQLQEDLDQSKEISKEYCALRGSTCAAQRRVRSLRAELATALQHCAHLDACHREEVKSLKKALSEKQELGAALCEETRRATSSIRAWTRHRKDINRKQEDLLKQKESQIRLLKLRLEQGHNDTTLTRASENDTCTKCTSARSMNSFERGNRSNSIEGNMRIPSEEASCSKYLGSFTSSSKLRGRRQSAFETSGSERGITSPEPPQRPLRMKRFFCENGLCANTQEASVQSERCDAMTSASGTSTSTSDTPRRRRYHVGHVRLDTIPREVFGGSVEDVLTRVESAGAALADSLRRWNRRSHLAH